jgi:hypothetical protein
MMAKSEYRKFVLGVAPDDYARLQAESKRQRAEGVSPRACSLVALVSKAIKAYLPKPLSRVASEPQLIKRKKRREPAE